VLNPAAVVVGGALAQAGELLLNPLREAAQAASLPPAGTSLRILSAALGDQACALGAVALVLGQGGQTPMPTVV